MSKLEFEFSINSKRNISGWKIFLISLISVFIIVTLQYLGIKPMNIISPLPIKADILDSLRPKLEQKQNNYRLKKQTGLVEQSFAASDFDNASSYVVVDYDSGNILFDKSPSTKLSIASLTKLMTAVVALDLASPNNSFTVIPRATNIQPTIIGVKQGEVFTLEELLNAALLTSANDASEVIRGGIDQKYGDGTFVKAMNAKATYIGLQNTHFTNPQGFDIGDNYSSAEDLAILSHYALTNYPLIAQIVKKDFASLDQTQTHRQFNLPNWNGLLNVYPGTLGLKIGNTDLAGNTSIVLSQREGKKILAVLLGASSILNRDLWASELLDAGFEKSLGLPAIEVSEYQLRQKYLQWNSQI